VGLLAQKAEILYDPDDTTEDTLMNQIKALGFGAELLENDNRNERLVEFLVSFLIYDFFSQLSAL
jgi:hypothetical protein